MTRVLLITGARSLADDPAAEAWARGQQRASPARALVEANVMEGAA